jgi:hypothetical protein
MSVAAIAKRAYWREDDAQVLVEAWRRSGEPVSRFAARHEVDARRIARWARRLRAKQAAPVRFHAVRLATTGASEAIEVQLGDGWRVRVPRGFDLEDLRRVLAVLGERETC